MNLAAAMAVVLAFSCTNATSMEQSSAGSLEILTATTGSDLDVDGYEVTVDGASQSIGLNDQITFSDLSAGDHEVTLSDVAGNCTISGGSLRTVTIRADDVAQTTFTVTCTEGGGAGAGDIYSWDFESVGGPRNDRFGRLEVGGGDAPINLNAVNNAALAAQGSWFAESLDLSQVGNNPPNWRYVHSTWEGAQTDDLFVRLRILFTRFAPNEDPKTVRFFNAGNTDLGYILIRDNGQLEFHGTTPGNNVGSGPGFFKANTWHWLEVGLTNIMGTVRCRVWLDGRLLLDVNEVSVGPIAATALLWAGGGLSEDQPFSPSMQIRFDQIDFATSHMGIP